MVVLLNVVSNYYTLLYINYLNILWVINIWKIYVKYINKIYFIKCVYTTIYKYNKMYHLR